MKHYWHYDFPVGRLGIAEDGTGITHLYVGDGAPDGYTAAETPLLQRAGEQLGEYFAGSRRAFDLPLSLQGTPFQQAVWAALQAIPYGETCSYKQVAQQVGNPKASRAVGMANNRNKVMIVVPCHRVVGADGALVGYAGGLGVKAQLLELEKANPAT